MFFNFNSKKISKIIYKSLGEIFMKDIKKIFINKYITITYINFFKDLNLLKVYIDFGIEKDKFYMLYKIEKYNSYIRKLLGNYIGKKIKKIPYIKFYIDNSLGFILKINNLLLSSR